VKTFSPWISKRELKVQYDAVEPVNHFNVGISKRELKDILPDTSMRSQPFGNLKKRIERESKADSMKAAMSRLNLKKRIESFLHLTMLLSTHHLNLKKRIESLQVARQPKDTCYCIESQKENWKNLYALISEFATLRISKRELKASISTSFLVRGFNESQKENWKAIASSFGICSASVK